MLMGKKSIAFDLSVEVEHDSKEDEEQNMVTIETRLKIDHPPHEVWSLFADPRRWNEISPLLRSLYPEEPFELGTVHTLLVAPEGLHKLKIMVEIIGKMDTYLCWRGGRAGIWAEHYFYAQSDSGGERTTWIHGERFYGRLGSLAGALVGHKIQRSYESFNRDLAACLNRVI
jgi:hypothetical protein